MGVNEEVNNQAKFPWLDMNFNFRVAIRILVHLAN